MESLKHRFPNSPGNLATSGLTLGTELNRLGISALILDRLEAGANTSRAVVIHARTLDVLEP